MKIYEKKSLCYSCRWCVYIKRSGSNGEIAHCTQMGRQIQGNIEECTAYSDKTTPMQHELESIAWILLTDASKTKKIGFVPPKEYQKMQFEEGKGE